LKQGAIFQNILIPARPDSVADDRSGNIESNIASGICYQIVFERIRHLMLRASYSVSTLEVEGEQIRIYVQNQ
jgi:hypothetical protein